MECLMFLILSTLKLPWNESNASNILHTLLCVCNWKPTVDKEFKKLCMFFYETRKLGWQNGFEIIFQINSSSIDGRRWILN